MTNRERVLLILLAAASLIAAGYLVALCNSFNINAGG